MQIRRAQRSQAKMRLALLGPAGSGKTYSALQLAFGLGQKVGLIDTEHGSGELYADLGEYDVITLQPPFTVASYLAAIRAFERAGHDTIIIDSLSHAWAGDGGLLDKVDKIKGNSPNGFAAWRTVTPEHNSLVEAMLQSPAHIIGTMRTRTEYVVEVNDKGKQVPRKIGLAPVQRDGLEYEFTVVLEVNADHIATASKDRTSLFDGQWFKVTRQTGEALRGWLAGAAPQQQSAPAPAITPAAAAAAVPTNAPTEIVDPQTGEVFLPEDFAKDQDWWRITTLLNSDGKTKADIHRIIGAENNKAAIARWPEPWKAVMRGIVRQALDRCQDDQRAA